MELGVTLPSSMKLVLVSRMPQPLALEANHDVGYSGRPWPKQYCSDYSGEDADDGACQLHVAGWSVNFSLYVQHINILTTLFSQLFVVGSDSVEKWIQNSEFLKLENNKIANFITKNNKTATITKQRTLQKSDKIYLVVLKYIFFLQVNSPFFTM